MAVGQKRDKPSPEPGIEQARNKACIGNTA